jgi:hypothetical protein
MIMASAAAGLPQGLPLISGSIMLYLVVDAQGVFGAQSDRIGKVAVGVLPQGCGIMFFGFGSMCKPDQ